VRAHLISDVPFGAFLSEASTRAPSSPTWPSSSTVPSGRSRSGLPRRNSASLPMRSRRRSAGRRNISLKSWNRMPSAFSRNWSGTTVSLSGQLRLPTFYLSRLARGTCPWCSPAMAVTGFRRLRQLHALDEVADPQRKRILEEHAPAPGRKAYARALPAQRATLENWLKFIHYLDRPQRSCCGVPSTGPRRRGTSRCSGGVRPDRGLPARQQSPLTRTSRPICPRHPHQGRRGEHDATGSK